LDEPGRREDEVALVALGDEPIRGAARDDDVVTVAIGQVAEDRLERPLALMDEDDLVALAVSVVVLHRSARPAERDFHVVVPHEELAARDRVALGLDSYRPEVPVLVCARIPLLAFDPVERADLLDPAGRMEV